MVVRVVPRRKPALKFKLVAARGTRFARSHNSGIVPGCLKFNQGFFRDASLARAEFELTAAHEFGHSILLPAGGLRHSWGHKGTAAVLLQRTRRDAPCYPQQGEVDLMRYYNPPCLHIDDRLARSRAASEDVLALIRLGDKRGKP